MHLPTRVCAALLVVVVWNVSIASNAADKVEVSGGWNVDVDIAGNTGSPVFTFKQDGEKLAGRYKGRFGEADVTGKLKGDEIEFTIEAQGAKVIYKGTVKKDGMEGTVDYDGQASGTWKAKKIDVTGTWNVEIELGGNSGTPEFTLKQEADKVTGKYKGQFGDADLTGKVTGDQIEFSFEVQGNKIAYKGTIAKDSMKGEADYAGQAEGTWTGKRKVEPK
ncbi:MAG TPA: hypothetical protein VGG64_09030 [Pirellulales bacterium]|jgi:hypothetical protein